MFVEIRAFPTTYLGFRGGADLGLAKDVSSYNESSLRHMECFSTALLFNALRRRGSAADLRTLRGSRRAAGSPERMQEGEAAQDRPNSMTVSRPSEAIFR